MRSSGGDEDVIDRRRQALKEAIQGSCIIDVEHRRGLCADRVRGLLQALRIASGDDHGGSLGAGEPRRLQADTGAAAEHDHGLAR